MNIQSLMPDHITPIMPIVLGSALLLGLSVQTLSVIMLTESFAASVFSNNAPPLAPVATVASKPSFSAEASTASQAPIEPLEQVAKIVPVLEPIMDETISMASKPELAPTPLQPYPALRSKTENNASEATAEPAQLTPVALQSKDLPTPVATLDEPIEEQAAASHKDNLNWFGDAAKGHYTLQLVMAKNQTSTRRFFDKQSSSAPMALLALNFKGKPWYAVVKGIYPDSQSATTAADAYEQQSGRKAWVRSVGSVRRDLSEQIVSTHP